MTETPTRRSLGESPRRTTRGLSDRRRLNRTSRVGEPSLSSRQDRAGRRAPRRRSPQACSSPARHLTNELGEIGNLRQQLLPAEILSVDGVGETRRPADRSRYSISPSASSVGRTVDVRTLFVSPRLRIPTAARRGGLQPVISQRSGILALQSGEDVNSLEQITSQFLFRTQDGLGPHVIYRCDCQQSPR